MKETAEQIRLRAHQAWNKFNLSCLMGKPDCELARKMYRLIRAAYNAVHNELKRKG